MLRQAALAVSFVTAVACGDSLASVDSTSTDPAPAAAKPADPTPEPEPVVLTRTTAGAVSGTIKLKGDAPEPESVDVSSDPVCQGHHPDGIPLPTVRKGAGGGLADVFVQLTTGVPDERRKAPDEPVILDQQGCTYVPHVFGVMKKQTIKILNSDDTLHNIHPTPKTNREFNLAMPNKGDVREQEFKKAEEAVAFKCDVHTWMKAWCFVMEHPYYGVTDENGAFTIDAADLPDGEYGVKLWHETLGTKEGTVEISGGTATYDFTYES